MFQPECKSIILLCILSAVQCSPLVGPGFPINVAPLNDFHFNFPPIPPISNEVENHETYAGDLTQYHAEDSEGHVVYGFHAPDQFRTEARSPDGTVKGSYSYIDPSGFIVRMQYWDNGEGMHMAGNNLPVAIHKLPEFTPEVKKAREEHFKLYQEALENLRAAGLSFGDEDDDSDSDLETLNHHSSEDSSEGNPIADDPNNDKVILVTASQDSDPLDDPKYETSDESKGQSDEDDQDEATPSETQSDENDDDPESIAIDNPEFRTAPNGPKTVNPTFQKQPASRAFFYHFSHSLEPQHEMMAPSDAPSENMESKPNANAAAVHDAQVPQVQDQTNSNTRAYPVYFSGLN